VATTIKDVARRAGVSISTASMVLRTEPNPRISKATRERVQKAAEELNYCPNFAARSLRSHKTFVIGMVMNRLKWHDTLEFIFPVENYFRPLNHHVIMGFSEDNVDEERRYVEEMTHGRVDGLILRPVDRSDVSSLEYFASASIPVVLIDGPDRVSLPSAKRSRADGIVLCMQHLYRLGRRHIGLGMISGGFSGLERLEGYHSALEELGLPFEEDLILPGAGKQGDLYEIGYELAADVKAVPRLDAIICSNDLYAVGLIRGSADCGVRVPEDISVVGFTNLPASRYNSVPLTTVDQQYERVAQKAAELLWEQMNVPEGEAPPPARHVNLRPRLVVRESCGAGVLMPDSEPKRVEVP